MTNREPIKEFEYPKGERMCLDGKARAALWASQILNEEISPEELEHMARRGKLAIEHNADTNKRNLIALIVYRHAHCGDLEEFTTNEGDFLSNGRLNNINDKKFKRLLNDLTREQGGDL